MQREKNAAFSAQGSFNFRLFQVSHSKHTGRIYRKEAELFEKVRPAAKAKAASITQISHGLQTTTPFVNQTPSLALCGGESTCF
jgi:hypothetical protein